MSHFTVLVVGEDVEEQLARFEENTENLPKEWLQFEDKEEEYLQKYENEFIEMKHLPDGSLVYKWDKEYLLPKVNLLDQDVYVFPEGTRDIDVAYNVLFNTFEDFMREHCGYSERDPETNRYGYWNNANAKWDWYQVGGRWTGFFKLKDGASGEIGHPGVFQQYCSDETRADVAKKEDIDWKAMIDEYVAERLEKRNQFLNVLNGRELPLWKDIKEKHIDDFDSARKEYNDNPIIKDLYQAGFFTWGVDVDKEYGEYLLPKEEFVSHSSKEAICTFAVVKDGEWYERGEMGWWGIVTNEEDTESWSERWYNLVMSLPEDTLLTVVDCHI